MGNFDNFLAIPLTQALVFFIIPQVGADEKILVFPYFLGLQEGNLGSQTTLNSLFEMPLGCLFRVLTRALLGPV